MIKPGIYRHYRGRQYGVIGIAKHSETLENLVIYEPLYESETKFWARPEKMFLEEVEVEGRRVPRFEFIKTG